MNDHRSFRSQLLTAEDAADAVSVPRTTLREWTRRGLLPRHGTTRNPLYHWRDLIAAKDAAKPRRDATRRDIA